MIGRASAVTAAYYAVVVSVVIYLTPHLSGFNDDLAIIVLLAMGIVVWLLVDATRDKKPVAPVISTVAGDGGVPPTREQMLATVSAAPLPPKQFSIRVKHTADFYAEVPIGNWVMDPSSIRDVSIVEEKATE